MSTAKTKPHAYWIGDADAMCRYPVHLKCGPILGYVSRWHRNWETETSAGRHSVGRPPVEVEGKAFAAAHMFAEYEAGLITPIGHRAPAVDVAHGPAPLLDPRMPDTPTNRARAREVIARLHAFHWTPAGGYPGADNLWLLRCDLDQTTHTLFWSHLRGRNGQPPSARRHAGCLPEDEVRRLIPAYGPAKAK